MMTYTGGEYSVQDLFRELKEQVKRENVRTFEEYAGLADDIIEKKKNYGFFTDEEDLVQIKHNLEQMWHEINRE